MGDTYQPAIAADVSQTSSEASCSLSALIQLVDRELGHDAGESPGTEFRPTLESIQQEVEQLHSKQLSTDLDTWIARYAHVGERTPYLWTWCRQGVEVTCLPTVGPDHFDHVCDTKFLGVMLDVLLDDVADQGGDERLLEQLVSLPVAPGPLDWGEFLPNEQAYAQLAEAVWQEVSERTQQFPRYEEFADLLRYDYLQLMNTMRYSHLLNRMPALLNMAEHDLYLPHNMHMMISATMDLMCSPDFDFREVGRLREAIWHAQYMGRIGNLITTWQRELFEGDFTSGVFARAVMMGHVSLDQLETGDREKLQCCLQGEDHEAYFLGRWQEHRNYMLFLQDSLHSVDLHPLVRGLERLICLHLASRGLK